MKKMTHTAIYIGVDNRVRSDFKCKVKIRETKKYWITFYGTKFKKACGRTVGDWPMYKIDLSTIKLIGDDTP